MSTNELIREKSPYLKQHAQNPVHWKAWSPATLALAQSSGKPLFVSIGYATCHWCHVMEHESFENRQIADALNANFICIKIDREEHPDIDSIYMNSVQLMTGRGGWPLNVFLDSDLKPFFGGTYFRPAVFLNLLEKIYEAWQNDRAALVSQGEQLYQHLVALQNEAKQSLQNLDQILAKYLKNFEATYDHQNGGKNGAPKFPLSYDLILLAQQKTPGNQGMIRHTLAHMGRSGTYDHLEGGLHRYATDAEWKVPHFEKMLYDQAGFIEACLADHLGSQDSEPLFLAELTANYVTDRLCSPQGGLFAAEDADSEGSEGKFYRWDENELRSVIGDKEFASLKSGLDWPAGGNFESHYVLHITCPQALPDWHRDHAPSLAKMRDHRAQRARPLMDTKVLTSWNGLALRALARLEVITGKQNAKRQQAIWNGLAFVKSHLRDPQTGKLFRRWAEGEPKYQGTLADYAFLISALIESVALEPKLEIINWIAELFEIQEQEFSDHQSGLYWSTVQDEVGVLIREQDTYDNVEPAANSIVLRNFATWYALTGDERYLQRLERMLASLPKAINERPHGYPVLLEAIASHARGLPVYFVVSANLEFRNSQNQNIWQQNGAQSALVLCLDPRQTAWQEISWLKDKAQKPDSHLVYKCVNQACEILLES